MNETTKVVLVEVITFVVCFGVGCGLGILGQKILNRI